MNDQFVQNLLPQCGTLRAVFFQVTPILQLDDLETLQAEIRALCHARAKTPECTSQHIHFRIADFDTRQIANIRADFLQAGGADPQGCRDSPPCRNG